jgi:hypothetical protein
VLDVCIQGVLTNVCFQFVEEQAIDRVHRLNQTIDVKVYKLTIGDTVEQRIVDLQERKRQLANAAIEGKATAGKLTMRDMMALFGREAEARFDQGAIDLNQKTRLLVPGDDGKDGPGSGHVVEPLSSQNKSDSFSSRSLPSAQSSSSDPRDRQKPSSRSRAEGPLRPGDSVYGRRW